MMSDFTDHGQRSSDGGMRRAAARPLRLMLLGGAVAAVLLFAAWPAARSQPPMADADQTAADLESDPVYKFWRPHESVGGCSDCHYDPRGGFRARDTDFSQLNELRFWLANDKHAIARRRVEPLNRDELLGEFDELLAELERDGIVLQSLPADWFGESNVLSRRICDKLGFDVTTTEGYSRFRDHCLTCHGGYRGEADAPYFAREGDRQPGISCNYCHQIGDNDDWVARHGEPRAAERWRLLPPGEKAEAGMRDLVNVITQASNCNDCHIGNRDAGMYVTHAMYAAGHPPLPGIELQTFCRAMPQHWRSDAEAYEAMAEFEGRDDYFEVNFPQLFADGRIETTGPDKIFWDTRKVLLGAIAAKLHTIDLVIASAPPDRWGDYALYDCTACHHELREPSLRQERGYVSAPGRPRLHEWPDALIRAALDVAGPSHRESYDRVEAKYAAAVAQNPFGDPAVVVPVAKEMQQTLQGAVSAVEGRPITASGARAILMRLTEVPVERLLVYDSARQVVWAMQAIAAELSARGEPLPEEQAALIESLSGDGGRWEPTGIETELPAGRAMFIYPKNLNAELIRRAEFDPQVLQERLKQIRDFE